ncbi:hypothetical protein Pan241w_35970 [Gimesia alba]|uniref:Uncharacterized protein n=1 Tax=Gimesia alba TaxID=2527973 RepID=A0A517RHZ2_9PLAN|nr:hypothetical protein [Gimesia alba]QDT43496.1 hypothetical protein Pan241w_35970 [Gimesia alba]
MAFALLKYCVWQIFAKGGLGIVYIAIIAEGLRQLVPTLGQKLYKLPGLTFLQDYEATYRLDIAPIFALFLMIAVWFLWGKVLQMWLVSDFAGPGWNSESYAMLVYILAFTILGADMILFYSAVTQMGWSGSSFSFSAVIATAAYVGVLIFVSFVSLNLYQQVND